MKQALTLFALLLSLGCASKPTRVQPAPAVPAAQVDSNQTIVVSVETTQSEVSGSEAGIQAVLKATGVDDPELSGEVKLGIGSGGAHGGQALTLQVDRETWRAIMQNPDIWAVSFADGKWQLSNNKARGPEPSSALPLSVEGKQQFSSSRSARLNVTLDRQGRLVGTFTLENDAMVVGFGASAAVDLLDEDGEVLDSVQVQRQEISGKPPGKAIRRDTPVDTTMRNQSALSRVQRLRIRFLGGN